MSDSRQGRGEPENLDTPEDDPEIAALLGFEPVPRKREVAADREVKPVVERPVETPLSGMTETCDYCGSARLEWRKCKLICLTCSQINKSCADL